MANQFSLPPLTKRPVPPALVLPGVVARQSAGSPVHVTTESCDAAAPFLQCVGSQATQSRRKLPARLRAIDDQVTVPRELYAQMMRLGDGARGSLGYGQHRLVYAGPNGAPVLRS